MQPTKGTLQAAVVCWLILSGSVWSQETGLPPTPDAQPLERTIRPDADPRLLPQEMGILIKRVIPSSPAHRAGIEANDIILAVDGVRVQSLRDLSQALRNARGRIRVDAINWRNGDRTSVFADLQGSSQLGIYGEPVPIPGRDHDRRTGVRVTRVWPRSPADEAGLEVGAVIVNVNGTRIDDLGDLVWALRQAMGSVRMTVIDPHTRNRRELFVSPNSRGKIGIDGEPVAPRDPYPY
jgi:S1-C subfamily serine protease